MIAEGNEDVPASGSTSDDKMAAAAALESPSSEKNSTTAINSNLRPQKNGCKVPSKSKEARRRQRNSNSNSPFSSEGSIDSVAIPSLHGSLLRVREQRDPLRYYEIIKVLGDGSMGSVSKVQKRKSAVGGSARKSFVNRERRHQLCFGFFDPENCGAFCPLRSGEKKNSKDAFVSTAISWNSASMETIDESLEQDIRQEILPSQQPQPGGQRTPFAQTQQYSTVGSSSIITFEHKDVFYALKSIHLDRCRDVTFREELLNEIGILQSLDHPNIVKAMETFDFRDRLYLILELCSGGDLYARDPYDETQACSIVHSLLDAVAYMHSKGITHRDLKFENVMFSSPTSNIVKVIDFGLSKKYSQKEHLHDTVGTVYTMAPEVLKGDYNNKCDVWSMGVIAFMLLSSSIPFYGKTRQHVVRKIVNGKYGFKGRRWKNISQFAREFVMDCLVQEPSRRKSADEMLKHPFIKRNEDISKASVSFAMMDRVQATIQTFCEYEKLKKLALLVIAHKSTDDEIGFLRKVFDRFDFEKDGEITLKEFMECLKLYHYSENDVERMFIGMDLDGTGKVHYSEFLAATMEAHGAISEERIAEAFDRLDSDDSGYISVQNIRGFLGESISEEYASSIIDEADPNHDHQIDYTEFLALWNAESDTRFRKALKDVNFRRVSFDEDTLDDSRTDASIASTEEGTSVDSSEISGGAFFFGQEKEKSIRGVWV